MTAEVLTAEGSPEMHRPPLVPDAAASETERRKFPRDVVEDVLMDLCRLFDPSPSIGRTEALCERMCAVGPENKHAVHVPSGLPLDLFAATAENWHNRLVVTTGPRESNVRIAAAARKMNPGWEWEVYDAGFVPLGGTWAKCERTRRTMRSEREVFAFVGMECPEPEDRR